MEKVRILGVDPSLRNTGLAVIEFNSELPTGHPDAYKVSHCQVISNPAKYTGKDAIMNMLDMLTEQAQKDCYKNVDQVIVESPSIMYHAHWSGGTISSIAHIAGGAIVIFGINKCQIFRPNEWNKNRKKEITHSNVVATVGHADKWHYEKRLKNDKLLEHIGDAIGIGLFWIKSNYLED